MSYVVDLDAAIAAQRDAVLKSTRRVPLRFGGQDFTLQTVYNAPTMLNLLGSKTGAEAVPFLLSCVVEEDRDRFEAALLSAEGMTSEVLGTLLSTVVEAVTGRPTDSLSDASRTSRSRKSGTKSKATSSAPEEMVDSLD